MYHCVVCALVVQIFRPIVFLSLIQVPSYFNFFGLVLQYE